jgi:predicted RNase H-like nuclease
MKLHNLKINDTFYYQGTQYRKVYKASTRVRRVSDNKLCHISINAELDKNPPKTKSARKPKRSEPEVELDFNDDTLESILEDFDGENIQKDDFSGGKQE